MSSTPTASRSRLRREAFYTLPRDGIFLHTNDERVLTLADRLWDRGTPAHPALGKHRPPLHLAIDVRRSQTPIPRSLTEQWALGTNDVELNLSRVLYARIECVRGTLRGSAVSELLDRAPSLVARLLLETSVAAMLARRSYGVIHAGAVAGPLGAVVIRGAPGAGKSTLVAAAHRSGLQILGDETVLAARDHPDDLLAAVRDVTLLPDAADLLALRSSLVPVNTRGPGEEKLRLDLFPSSTPAVRRARRIATILLGSRNSGPARLEPLSPGVFLDEFSRGAIAQEKWSGTPGTIATCWARSGAYRLSGTADLAGAVALLSELLEVRGARCVGADTRLDAN